MITLLDKIAVQNTDAPATIAILNNIMDGVDGSGAFNLTQETTDIKRNDGQTQMTRQNHELDIRVIEETAESAKIDAMQAAGNLAIITGLTPDGVVLFSKPSRVNRNKVHDHVFVSQVMVTIAHPPGYAGNAPNKRRPVYVGPNLLGTFDVLSGDELATPGFLNGFTQGSAASASVAGEVQTFAVTTAVAQECYLTSQPVFFPFPGKTITASADVTARSGTGASGVRVSLRFIDAAGDQVGALAQAPAPSASIGINSVTAVVPANTAFVQFCFSAAASGLNVNISFKRPMVSVGTSTNFAL